MKQQLRHTDAYLLLLAPVFIMMFVLSMAIPVHSAEQTISHVSTSDELIAAIESSDVTSIVFDNNIVRSVESAAFENDDSIEAVIIPENVIDIGERAFADCNQLSSVTIVNTSTTLEDSAFDGCEDVYFLCPLESQAYYYAVNHGIPYKEYEE